MTTKRKAKEAWAMNGFEEWGGYMAAKKAKLDEQFQERAAVECSDTSNLFQGICIFVNGYTKPSADELRLLMMRHNGVYHHYMRPRITTHIIASNLPYSKIIMYKKSQNPLPICKPEWITDSLNAGRLLNYQDYLLYSHHTKTQPKLAFNATSKDSGRSDDQGIIPVDVPRNSLPDLPLEESNARSDSESGKSNTIVKERSSPSKESGSRSINSTKNPEFLNEFYNNSRLHHISTMGATFKDYINELRDKSDKSFPGLERLKELKKSKQALELTELANSDSEEELLDASSEAIAEKRETVVMHIDMDCFFVSVGLRNRPELKGLPVAVTHAKGGKAPQNANTREIEMKMYQERLEEKLKNGKRNDEPIATKKKSYENSSLSEIASCSYEARKAGIKNGMFLGQALKLCPDLKTIPYDFEGYKEVSYALYDTVATYTLDIEAVSCDEMYADCTKIISESGLGPLEIAEIIRKQITEKTGCPVSTGFGGNKLQARLATKKAKPNGQFYLESKNVRRYMSTIGTRDLPGVGPTITYKLNKMGVHSCAELQSVGLGELQKEFGKKTGEMLYNMCRGIDNLKLNLEHVRKSVSAEVNYGIRFEGGSEAEKFLKQLCDEVCSRLNKANAKGRCVTLKLMIRSKNAPVETAKYMGHGFCDNITRSKNLISSVNNSSIITKEVLSLWNQMQQIPEDVRGVGIQISRLESTKISGSSNLMSFINKGNKNPEVDNNEEKNVSEENSLKEFKQPKLRNDSFLNRKRLTCEKEVDDIKKSASTVQLVCPFSNASSSGEKSNGSSKSEIIESKDIGDDRVSVKEIRHINGENNSSMKDIDESVLTELPEEIRKEIMIGEKNCEVIARIENKDKNVPLVQKKQDSYFKESKRNIDRVKKSEMPPIQEIDLAVLLELPDDIRNEILNEYRTKARESKESQTAGCSSSSEAHNKRLINEADLSISQVDPEVLAELPKDIQNDVKNYCASKKIKENRFFKRADQINSNKNVPIIIKQFGTTTSKLLTNNQKIQRQTKFKTIGTKNSKTGRNKKNFSTTTNTIKNSKLSPDSNSNRIVKIDNKISEQLIFHSEEIESKIDKNSIENIRSLSMAAKSGDPDDQKMLLKLLVEEFMSLSLKEVKLQIQNWISTSDSINKVDFLAFTTFLSSLPKEKRIEDLHVLLKTMHRCIEKIGVCVWHRAYKKTIEIVQRQMLATYDSSIMVPFIKCDNFDCKIIENFLNDEI